MSVRGPLNSELLDDVCAPPAPIKDLADGDAIVPINAEAFGLWVEAALDPPTTSSESPRRRRSGQAC